MKIRFLKLFGLIADMGALINIVIVGLIFLCVTGIIIWNDDQIYVAFQLRLVLAGVFAFLICVLYAATLLIRDRWIERKGPSMHWQPLSKAVFFYSNWNAQHSLAQFLNFGELRDVPDGVPNKYSLPKARIGSSEFVEATVDAEKQKFSWTWQNQRGHTFSISTRPWEMSAAVTNSVIPQLLWQEMNRKAEFAWSIMVDGFNEEVDAGNVKVWARVGRATAPLSLIPADVWKGYSVVDWGAGSAQCEAGEPLFSVFAEKLT